MTASLRRIPPLHLLAATFAINTAIALALTVSTHGPWQHNFVFSHCIGFTAWLLIDPPRRMMWRDRAPMLAPLLLHVAVASLAAWFIGSFIAARVLGMQDHVMPPKPQTAYGLIAITIAAGLALTGYFWSRERIAASDRQAAEARLALLSAQIEPHFLFNTLANLQALIATDTARAQAMLGHLDRYLRSTLAATRGGAVRLDGEFALTRAYLEIIAIRMERRLAFSLDLPEALGARSVPPMLLQPLVENAVRHGLEPKIEGGRITVMARAADGALVLTVEDDGVGIAADRPERDGGVGVANLRERLATAFGREASLTLEPGPSGGTRATVRLPMGEAA
jgi:sensor histidine kinase YesM